MAIADIQRARAQENRRQIYDWFVANPCHSHADAAKALGMTPHTVGKHARAIRAGWRPPAPDPGPQHNGEWLAKNGGGV